MWGNQAKVCKSVKDRIKDNQAEESWGLRWGAGAEPMFLSFMPHKLSFRASLQGLLIWKRQTHPLRSGELVVSIDNADIRSLFMIHSALNQRRVIFTRYLFGWPLSILAYTSRSAPRLGGSQEKPFWVFFLLLPVMRLYVAVSHSASRLTRLRQCICQTATVNQGVCHVG